MNRRPQYIWIILVCLLKVVILKFQWKTWIKISYFTIFHKKTNRVYFRKECSRIDAHLEEGCRLLVFWTRSMNFKRRINAPTILLEDGVLGSLHPAPDSRDMLCLSLLFVFQLCLQRFQPFFFFRPFGFALKVVNNYQEWQKRYWNINPICNLY